MKTKRTEYAVADAHNSITLERTVQVYLDKGWSLQGGVSVSVGPNSHILQYAQALVREVNALPAMKEPKG